MKAGWPGDIQDDGTGPAASRSICVSVHSAARTSTGAARELNQDNFMCSDENRLWAVADGIGGGYHGEVASRMVVEALFALEMGQTPNGTLQTVRTALESVNADIRRRIPLHGSEGYAGSTVVALVLRGSEWVVAWAGDSRAYLFRDGDLIQLTADHSLRDRHPGDGETAGEAPARNGIITRAVGVECDLLLDEVDGEVLIGDRFLLCSDGVHSALAPSALALALTDRDTAMAAREVLEAALAAKAGDDATAIVVDVQGWEGAASEPQSSAKRASQVRSSSMVAGTEITALLLAYRDGDRQALDRLMPAMYDELRSLAQRYMRKESGANTLQATALVHEVYARMVNVDLTWQNRAHFLGSLARLMRQILVDHARARKSVKRGGCLERVTLDESAAVAEDSGGLVLELDRVLGELRQFDELKSRIIELRFFGGLTYDDAAAALDISKATLDRELRLAKAWLRHRMQGDGPF